MRRSNQTSSTIETTPAESYSPSLRFDATVPLIGLLLFAVCAILYFTQPVIYNYVLSGWMLIPFKYPYLDLEAIPSWSACWRLGVDVYATNPCDVLGRVANYSPIWLRLAVWPVDRVWTVWLGSSLAVLFLLSLGWLPQPRRTIDRVVVVLGSFSCLPVYAIERANADIIVFLLAVIAGVCLGYRTISRMFSYGLMIVAGLLKFYPFVVLIMALRERPRVFIAVALAAATVLAIFVGSFHGELIRAMDKIPRASPFHDSWGAKDLPAGLGYVLWQLLDSVGLHPTWASQLAGSRVLAYALAPFVLGSMAVTAAFLGRRPDIRAALVAIPAPDRDFVLIGATLIVGCFLAGRSSGYRGIFLLFVLPGVLALARVSTDQFVRRISRITVSALMFVLWDLSIRQIVAIVFGGDTYPIGNSVAIYLYWVAREVAWWWVATFLLAVLIWMVITSQTWRYAVSLVTARTKQADA